jgi:NAD(P)-dependent dehydrogenase (short-subunit alcohol dehydrogenase family)
MHDIRGRVAVVTGAAGGIGRALSSRFVHEGAAVVMADIDETALARAVNSVRSDGGRVLGVPIDVTQADQVEDLAVRARREFGRVDIVCNNAGVGSAEPAVASSELWNWLIDTNLYGVINGCRTFVPLLSEQGSGHIVNTASIFGLCGAPGMVPFSTTQAAIVGFSEALAYELANDRSPIGVSVICSGFVKSGLGDSERVAPDGVRGRHSPRSERALGIFAAGQKFDIFTKVVFNIGLDPAVVGDATMDAIKQNRFFVLTHPEAARQMAEGRLRWMFDNEPPELNWQNAFVP